MKAFVVVCLCGLSWVMPAAQSKLGIFTSPDSIFQFKYSSVLVQCSLEQTERGLHGSWAPEGCLCDDEDSATTIACFAYPKDNFKDKPTFVGAAFFVAEVRPAITPSACLQGSRNWLVRNVHIARINSVSFKTLSCQRRVDKSPSNRGHLPSVPRSEVLRGGHTRNQRDCESL